jgi:hypothetical protein
MLQSLRVDDDVKSGNYGKVSRSSPRIFINASISKGSFGFEENYSKALGDKSASSVEATFNLNHSYLEPWYSFATLLSDLKVL